jgi:hypothetical protein
MCADGCRTCNFLIVGIFKETPTILSTFNYLFSSMPLLTLDAGKSLKNVHSISYLFKLRLSVKVVMLQKEEILFNFHELQKICFCETFSLSIAYLFLVFIAEIQNSKSIRNDKNYKKGALGHRKDNTRLVNRSDWLLNRIRRIRLHNILWKARGRGSQKLPI